MNLSTTGLTMSSLDIATLTRRRHDNVKRLIDTLAEAQIITSPQAEETSFAGSDGRNQTVTCYMVGKRDSFVVVARISPEFTARLVDRWQDLEAALAKPAELPKTFADALRLAANLEEENQRQREAIALMAPKVELAEKVIADESLMALSDVAKELGVPRKQFFDILSTQRWIFKREQYDDLKPSTWLPMSDKAERGLLVLKKRPDHDGRLRDQTLVTGRGIAALQSLFH